LTAVRRALCRAAFLADFVLAMIFEHELRSGAYRGAVALRQRLRLPSGLGSRVLPSAGPWLTMAWRRLEGLTTVRRVAAFACWCGGTVE
jgi:hypothetical protein